MQDISYKNNFPTPYICGGAVRDFHLKNLTNISDLDITNGSESIQQLSYKTYEELNKKYNVVYKQHDNGNTSIYIGSFKLDFSSNFISSNIDDKLKAKGIDNPTSLDKEMYSRDFTFNSLLIDFQFQQIIDSTGRGLSDLDNRVITTCLDPFTTFSDSTNRVVRAIYMACKLDCDFHMKVKKCLKEHPELILNSSNKAMVQKLNLAIKYNKQKAINILDEYNFWKYIPPIAMIEDDQKQRLILEK